MHWVLVLWKDADVSNAFHDCTSMPVESRSPDYLLEQIYSMMIARAATLQATLGLYTLTEKVAVVAICCCVLMTRSRSLYVASEL